MKNPSEQTVQLLGYGITLVGLAPFLFLLHGSLTHGLGANPVEAITHATGLWALRLLLATLAITPLKKLSGLHWLVRMRRTMALYAFFYACLHVATYLVFDQFFEWREIVLDLLKRPYLTAGMVSFLMLTPLAATSTNAMVRYLGSRNWHRLHRLAYAAVASGIFHYFWLVKRDISEPALYAVILAILMCMRLIDAQCKRSTTTHKIDCSKAGDDKPIPPPANELPLSDLARLSRTHNLK